MTRGTGFQSTSNVIARSNLEAPAAQQTPPAAPGYSNPAPPRVASSIWGATLERVKGIVPPTWSQTSAQGPAPGGASSGAPPSPSSGATTLATLSPNVRTLLKLAPIGAAIYFFAKGDNVLGGVAAAGAVAAWAVVP